ncbi:MAG TPA: DNA alkylation repair protein [Gemmataceae bacterium]|nr:DNA alkylation repair protein [Gemmataceae bacterium]
MAKNAALHSLTAQHAQNRVRSLGDPAVAASSVRFFKKMHVENDTFIGLRSATLRQLAKDYRTLPLEEVEILLQSGIHEERSLALLILERIVHRAPDTTRKQVYDFYLANTRWINNWDLVDVSAPPLAGAYLADKSRQPLYRLARSPMLWERRIAIVATQHLIRLDDFADTLRISTMLLLDKEDLIHKAVGWMLREVGKRDQTTLEAFLKKHGRKMPRTMLRYAIERFEPEKRRAYLQGRV